MTEQIDIYDEKQIRTLIVSIHDKKVILDSDLAMIYGVTTKRLNEQVKRNSDRFPGDFVFRLSKQDVIGLRSQFATSNAWSDQPDSSTASRRGGRRYLPFAFTEHGAIMAANVLNSPRAIQMSIFVVRAFVKMRGLFGDTRELARRLATVEKELKERMDIHESAIVSILQRFMDVIDPPAPARPPARKRIGFTVKERAAAYKARKKR
jgi:hypothetical protein